MLHLESKLQRAVVELLGYRENRGELVAFGVPNGFHVAGHDDVARGRMVARLKAMGILRPGAPDLALCLKGGVFAAIELKSGEGRLSAEQRLMRDALGRVGACWAECRSIDEVERALDAWLGRPARRA